jgi:hypothetical protein
MLKTKCIFFTILFLGIGVSSLWAQNTVPATGGNASGTGGNVSYSIGQMFTASNNGSNGSISEGVQQAFEISVINAIEKFNYISLNCTVYPNPTSNYLQLKIENDEIEDLSYKLFNLTGALIESKLVTNAETLISMINLSVSTYILKVYNNTKEVKTFKIIKN